MAIREKVKGFWKELGTSKPAGELVTHRDIDQVRLETDTILSLLEKNDALLDVGCGSGFSSSIYSTQCKSVLGIDYAETMIESAKKRYESEKLKFKQQDILTLDNRLGVFSVVVSTRCLINLSSWDEQKEAIKRIHNCLKANGRLILAEGSKQGREALNKLRTKVGLDPMPPVWHNIDFDEELLIPFLLELFDIRKDIRFGLYDVLTRVYYPLVINPDEPQYGTAFHRAARQLVQFTGKDPYPQYSREFIMELRKR